MKSINNKVKTLPFPYALPHGTRVVVSARYLATYPDAAAWRRRLGWEGAHRAWHMDLPPLTQEGMADVLRRMGVPLDCLAAKVDIVSELHRLSKGDPLLVKLYVDDLWSQGEAATRLRLEELRNIRPGLEGFFEDYWWKWQQHLWVEQKMSPLKEAAVQALLNLLACALGPLSRVDILDELVPEEVGLTAWTLDEALRPLARFIISDGQKQGYVFSHPRLGIYFNECLTPKQRKAMMARFLDWGARTLAALNDGELTPTQVSPYLVQYYGAHLEQANQDVNTFLPLLGDGWRRAWFELEGAYAGFLNDVQRVWKATEQIDERATKVERMAPFLGAELRCLLCFASINSLANNIPPDLLPLLVDRKIWSAIQALAWISMSLNVLKFLGSVDISKLALY